MHTASDPRRVPMEFIARVDLPVSAPVRHLKPFRTEYHWYFDERCYERKFDSNAYDMAEHIRAAITELMPEGESAHPEIVVQRHLQVWSVDAEGRLDKLLS